MNAENELKKNLEFKGMVLNRVPENTKKEFIKLSKEEFADDRGMCLKWCLEQAVEYQYMKSALFNGLFVTNQDKPVEQKQKVITNLAGEKIIKREVKK